jgi:hypothetical protein
MLAAALGTAATNLAIAQTQAPLTDREKVRSWKDENELASLAIIGRRLMAG